MSGKARAKTVKADAGSASVAGASLSQADRLAAEAPLAPLLALAEEFGRLLTRRELAKIRHRRAYALPEILLGAAVVASMLILIARALGRLAH